MPITFPCPNCGAGLNVREEYAGKNATCPQCGKPFVVPHPQAPAPAAPAFPQIQTGGRPAPAPASFPGVGAAPQQPAPQQFAPSPLQPAAPAASSGFPGVGPAAPGPAPAIAPLGATSPPTKPAPGMPAPGLPSGGGASPFSSPADYTSDAAAGEPPRRRYPALLLASRLYETLAIVVLVMGGIGLVLAMIAMLVMAMQTGSMLTTLMMGGVFCGMGALYVFLSWISLKAAAELLKLMLNVEHDQHITADAVQRIAQQSK